MNAHRILVILLLAASLSLVLPNVSAAQTTRIYELIHPIRAVAGSLDPIPITAIVFYNDSVAGNSVLVGMLDADKTPQTIVPGIVSSSSLPCVNSAPLAALCRMNIPAGSGSEQLTFRIGGILGDTHPLGAWNLNITAVLVDQAGKLIPGSTSSVPFAIRLTAATLTIIVPAAVTMSVDGVKQRAGPAQVPVMLGNHNITLPNIVPVDAGTRLRFDHW